MFNSIINSSETLDIKAFIIIILVALALGIVSSLTYRLKTKVSSSFAITLAMLPAIVAVVIMMVNGSIGAGIAVAGAFSLVRFRSIAGNAKEILAVFFTMAIGLILGMGYIAIACIFTAIICVSLLLLNVIGFGKQKETNEKVLRITIPESLNYSDVFNDVFEKYTDECKLVSVKTSNMGSLFKLTYEIRLTDDRLEKEMIDKLRVRNGNLEIAISIKEQVLQTEL